MDWLESIIAAADFLGLYRPTHRPGSGALLQSGSYSRDDALDLAGYVERTFGDPSRLAVADLGAGSGESDLAQRVAAIPWRRLISVEHSISHLDGLSEASYRAARHEILTGHLDQVFTEYRPGELDVALMLNVVHQFPKGKALSLLSRCETFFAKGAIVFTPVGSREDVVAPGPGSATSSPTATPNSSLPIANEDLRVNRGDAQVASGESSTATPKVESTRAKSVWHAAQFKRLGYDVTVYRNFFDRDPEPVDAAWAVKRWWIH